MVDELEKYLFDYMNNRVSALKQYLLTALDKQRPGQFFQKPFEEAKKQSLDLKNCEFLKDAGLFAEIPCSLRDQIRYRVFHLTSEGKQLAMELKQEMISEANQKITLL